MKLFLICFLALQLGQYGLQKLFMRQFFPLDGKLLFTPLGQLDKDTLFWTTMGTSRLFNHITGGIELLTAALIITPRFRPYGLILSTLVLDHILLLNLSFNIDVKLLVSLLLSISVLLSFPMLKAIYSSIKTGMIKLPSVLIRGRLKWAYWSMIFLVFLELGMGARSAMSIPDVPPVGSLLTRSFYMLNAEINTPKRIHFHGSGYLIEEFEGSIFNPLPMIEDRSVHMILLTEHDESLNYSIRGDTLFLSGTLAGEELAWQLLELDLAQLPLKQDAFRWMAP
jgi:hypothetical protein